MFIPRIPSSWSMPLCHWSQIASWSRTVSKCLSVINVCFDHSVTFQTVIQLRNALERRRSTFSLGFRSVTWQLSRSLRSATMPTLQAPPERLSLFSAHTWTCIRSMLSFRTFWTSETKHFEPKRSNTLNPKDQTLWTPEIKHSKQNLFLRFEPQRSNSLNPRDQTVLIPKKTSGDEDPIEWHRQVLSACDGALL